MKEKSKKSFKIISIIFLIIFLISLSYATIREIRYLKIKDDLSNIVNVKEKECLVYDKLKDETIDSNGNTHNNYYIYIRCEGVEDKIRISDYSDFRNYIVGNTYKFYTSDNKNFFIDREDVLNSYNPSVLFVIPGFIGLMYAIVCNAFKKF